MAFTCGLIKSLYRSSCGLLQELSNQILPRAVVELSYFPEAAKAAKWLFFSQTYYTARKASFISQTTNPQKRSLFGIVHLPLSLLVPLQYFHPHTSQTPTPSVVKAVWNYRAADVLARSHHSTASGHWAVISHRSHQLDSSAARNNKWKLWDHSISLDIYRQSKKILFLFSAVPVMHKKAFTLPSIPFLKCQGRSDRRASPNQVIES